MKLCILIILSTVLFSSCSMPGEDKSELIFVSSFVTYETDVQQILNARCVKCHQEGGVASWLKLDDYITVKQNAGSIKDSIVSRRMPPFRAVDDGTCNEKTFTHSNWMPQSEIDTISAWISEGMKEGDNVVIAPNNENKDLDQVAATTSYLSFTTNPSITITEDPNFAYLPAPELGKTDEYRCFIVSAQGLSKDYIISGFKFNSLEENGSAINLSNQTNHHMVLFDPLSYADVLAAGALDAADGVNGDGYPCFGGSIVPASITAIWAPGGDLVKFPENAGIKKNIDTYFIMQMHFFTGYGNQRTAPYLEFDVNNGATEILSYVSFPNMNLDFDGQNGIVVRSADAKLKDLLGGGAVDETPARLWGVFLHTHTLATAINLTSVEKGCLTDIPKWDFDWQRTYSWDSPINMTGAENLKVTCKFDSDMVAAGTTVKWGENTNDEMCWAFMLISKQ